jgi:hypothetical protein
MGYLRLELNRSFPHILPNVLGCAPRESSGQRGIRQILGFTTQF